MKRPIGTEAPHPAGQEAQKAKPLPNEGVLFHAGRGLRTGIEIGTLLSVATVAMVRRGRGRFRTPREGQPEPRTWDDVISEQEQVTLARMAEVDKAGAQASAGQELSAVLAKLHYEVATQDQTVYQKDS